MTAPSSYRLAVDLGTSTTIAMLRWPDGRVRPLLFDGSPLLSSAVLLGADGRLHVGRDAAHLARSSPERLEPNPKRRIDDDAVLLGASAVPVRDLLGAILRRVGSEANRVAGPIGDLTLTYPAAWGPRRATLLADAAQQAGLPHPRLVGEPVAAATYFAHTMNLALPLGSSLLVYDLGAGTCDLTLLRRAPHGFDVVATDGLNDVGGLDVDAAIVAFLEATYGRLWTDAVSRRQVWEEVRNAKEMLSRSSGTVIAIPSLGKEAPLGREQFDGLIAPVLRPTIALTKSLIRDTAGTAAPGSSTVVLLVGGASRIPLVATLLAEATGIPPVVIEQPELVVAEGALHLAPNAVPGGVPGAVSGGAPRPGVAGSGPATSTGTAAPVSGPGPYAPVSGPGYPESGPGYPVSGPAGPSAPVSGPAGPMAPVSGVSGPAGPVTGGPWAASGEFTAPSGVAVPPAGGGLAPGGFAPSGGRPPARRSRGGIAVLAALAVAVVLLAGAGVTGLVLLKGNDDGNRGGGGTGQPTSGTAQTGGQATGQPNGKSAAAKYQMAVLPENVCTKLDLGKIGSAYEKDATAPSYTRTMNTYASVATCSLARQHGTFDLLSASLTAFVYADNNQAAASQKQVLDSAKLNDPNLTTLTGIGDEAFVGRTFTQSGANTTLMYTVEVRDGNLRLTLLGTVTRANGPEWSDQDRRQFINDLGAAAKATLAKFGSG